uniref:Reverse transcriptase domain-containing protein n=1 Tax=Nelumbo nucifera TaxID=4432 RepID=A0A822XL50_NELNU|nr:TPA_asm: hypothetical protein HUJ06_021129 [Nelumbo nucifera]
MSCITTPSFNIIFKGSTLEPFKPTKRLRQGDPLSPYIFLICLETLLGMHNKVVANGEMKPFKFSRTSPELSHIFYADDLFIFLNASITQLSCIRNILDNFCNASGETINYNKSILFTSRNVPHRHTRMLARNIRVRASNNLDKYLGLPIFSGRVTKHTFHSMVSRVQTKLVGWKANTLSLASRLTLLQSTLSLIPLHAMQIFCLPSSTCQDVDKARRNFLWESSLDHRKLHLIKWEKILTPKHVGGLGIRDLHSLNLALLTKLAWHLYCNQDSLWSKVLISKYSKGTDVLDPYVKGHDSWI